MWRLGVEGKRMRGRWPKVILTPFHLRRLLKKQKNPLTALRLFKTAKTRYPDYSHNSKVYATMISILATSNLTTEIKQVVHLMKHDSCQCTDPLILSILNIYSDSGLLDEAVALFQDLPNFNCIDWTHSFHSLLPRLPLPQSCLLLFSHFFDPEILSRTRSFNFLISLLCASRLTETALFVFGEMHKQGCPSDEDTYSLLMAGLCSERRFEDADHLVRSMFWRFSRRGGHGRELVVYRSLLNTLLDCGRVEEAVGLLGRILKKGMKASGRHCTKRGLDVLLIRVRECVEEEGIERAKVLLREEMMKEGVAGRRSYCSMACALYGEGDVEGGDRMVEEMEKTGRKVSEEVYEAMVEAMCRGGEVERARRVVGEEGGNVKMCNSVMRGLYREGRWEEGVVYLREMMRRRAGRVPDRESYRVTVEALEKAGRFVEMSEMVERMIRESFFPTVDVYSRLVSGLCGIGRSYDGCVWFEEMMGRCIQPLTPALVSLVSSSCHSISETHRCTRFINVLLVQCGTKSEWIGSDL